jgi:hypothetical protein
VSNLEHLFECLLLLCVFDDFILLLLKFGDFWSSGRPYFQNLKFNRRSPPPLSSGPLASGPHPLATPSIFPAPAHPPVGQQGRRRHSVTRLLAHGSRSRRPLASHSSFKTLAPEILAPFLLLLHYRRRHLHCCRQPPPIRHLR